MLSLFLTRPAKFGAVVKRPCGITGEVSYENAVVEVCEIYFGSTFDGRLVPLDGTIRVATPKTLLILVAA